MKSCVTISLVEEARGGPFIFWDGLADGCRRAAEFGFDAVEVFPPSSDAFDIAELRDLLRTHQLQLAAVGTGAGWVKHGLSLTDAHADHRAKARDFVRSIVDLAGQFGASAIVGSMQGRWSNDVDHDQAMEYLAQALDELGRHARQYDAPLLYEPLNRYETNLCNKVSEGVLLLERLTNDNVKLLADLFHMNIEERNIAGAILEGRGYIGHVHFVDSNRHPAGSGHMDYVPIADALREIGYDGYASAEAFPLPDSQTAARMTIKAFREYLV